MLPLARLAAALLLGALLTALAYQIPVNSQRRHRWLRRGVRPGLLRPRARRAGAAQRAELAGSDGSARWTREVADLLFPRPACPPR